MSESCSCEHEIKVSLKQFERVLFGGHGFAPMYRCRYCGRLYVLGGTNKHLQEGGAKPAHKKTATGVSR